METAENRDETGGFLQITGFTDVIPWIIRKGKKTMNAPKSSLYKKVLFYGDSNAYGYDPAGFTGGRYPEESRWTNIVGQNLLGIWQVRADGMPGRSIPAGRYEWDYLESVIRNEMPFDLFAVMLGTNDIVGLLRPDAGETARRMEKLIDFVQKLMPESGQNDGKPSLPGILLIAPPAIVLTDQSYAEPYIAGDKSFAGLYKEEGEKLCRYYQEIAKSRNLFFTDTSDWLLQFAHDGVHLSETGHTLFAAEMMDVLRHIWNGAGHSCDSCALR